MISDRIFVVFDTRNKVFVGNYNCSNRSNRFSWTRDGLARNHIKSILNEYDHRNRYIVLEINTENIEDIITKYYDDTIQLV